MAPTSIRRLSQSNITQFRPQLSSAANFATEPADVTEAPILDWFHVGMRLQYLEQTADTLSADDPERAAARAVIVEEVERLHRRLCNGKAKDAQISIDRIRAVMHHFRGEQGQ